jgi:hypothetical protein
MESVIFFETLTSTYQITQGHIQEDSTKVVPVLN